MNLYHFKLDLKTGKLEKEIISDVVDINGCLVREKYKKYDLDTGNYTQRQCLNNYIVWSNAITYSSLKEDVDIEKLKTLALNHKYINDNQEIIEKIKKLEVESYGN